MSRIPAVTREQAGWAGRLAYGYARRRYGELPETAAVIRHHPGVFWTWAVFETANERMLRRLPQDVRQLAMFRTAVRIGCSWCVDFGSAQWARAGLDPDVLRAVAADNLDGLDDDAVAAIRYADAMTASPPQVDDATVADLRRRFGEDGVVELTYVVALENMRSRFNAAVGVTAQGYGDAETCRVAALRAAPR